MKRYRCIVCRVLVEFEGEIPPVYPFCGERCKLVDLGRWFNEQQVVVDDQISAPDGKEAERQ